VFFFSSRRRHTRFSRDWSSDVCSSDLKRRGFVMEPPLSRLLEALDQITLLEADPGAGVRLAVEVDVEHTTDCRAGDADAVPFQEIGRASCREGVESWDGGAGLKTTEHD